MSLPGTWTPQFHPVTLAVVVVLVALYVVVTRPAGSRPTKKQIWALVASMAALLVAGSWPVEDLAAHWSLTALVVQRLLLMLVAAPMLLVSLPQPVAAKLTKPRALDRVFEFVSRPVPAIIVFTAVAVGTLLTPAVAAQSSSAGARTAIDALVLMSGFVLWAPVLTSIPGASRPSALGRAVYLFVQSVIPGFPSVIFIFAHHPLYPGFTHPHNVFGLTPLVDQQIAGVVAKVATLPVLWSVAWVALSKGHQSDREGTDAETLTWAEVERRLERAERAERTSQVHDRGGRGGADMRPSSQPPPTT